MPIYIHSGEYDHVVDPKFQKSENNFYKILKSKVLFETNNIAHDMGRQYGTIGRMLNHTLTNIKRGPLEALKPKTEDIEGKGILREFS